MTIDRENREECYTFCTGLITFVLPAIVAVEMGEKSREGMVIVHLTGGQSLAVKDDEENGTETALIAALEAYYGAQIDPV
jgi:hypothetical protein